MARHVVMERRLGPVALYMERDAQLRDRMRRWGIFLTDIDYLWVHYGDGGRPLAVLDFKWWEARTTHASGWSVHAVRTLADAARVPYLVVKWHPEPWAFQVVPANTWARVELGDGPVVMTERRWCEWTRGLYGAAPTLGIRAWDDVAVLFPRWEAGAYG